MPWALDKAIKAGTRLDISVIDPPSGRSKALPALIQNTGESDAAFIIRARTVLNSHLGVLNGQLANEVDVTAQLRGGAGGPQEAKP